MLRFYNEADEQLILLLKEQTGPYVGRDRAYDGEVLTKQGLHRYVLSAMTGAEIATSIPTQANILLNLIVLSPSCRHCASSGRSTPNRRPSGDCL